MYIDGLQTVFIFRIIPIFVVCGCVLVINSRACSTRLWRVLISCKFDMANEARGTACAHATNKPFDRTRKTMADNVRTRRMSREIIIIARAREEEIDDEEWLILHVQASFTSKLYMHIGLAICVFCGRTMSVQS